MEELCFPSCSVQIEDKNRWQNEGFRLSSKSPLILEQHHGGPCVVVAAVQAHMLGHRFKKDNGNWETSIEDARACLVEAIVTIIGKVRENESQPFIFSPDFSGANEVSVETAAEALVYVESSMETFESEGGIIAFLCSLVSTRGIAQIKHDMDDATTGLTGEYGHSSQELLNLLLIGKATSQVHDGNVDIGGGMTLRGIDERPDIGFLTHMESLRYCQVGSLYKRPKLPIWVMGSTSHFSVLYCREATVNDESPASEVRSRVRRAFAEHDQAENGFIPIDKLGSVLSAVDLVLTDEEMSQLLAICEIPESGIVLWVDLWKAVRPLVLKPMPWSCQACTFNNPKELEVCEICGTQKQAEEELEQASEENMCYTLHLTHVNGLIKKIQGNTVGPVVTHFEITKVSKDLQAPSTHGAGEPIEEVIHTRWPGCVFAWPESGPPSITG